MRAPYDAFLELRASEHSYDAFFKLTPPMTLWRGMKLHDAIIGGAALYDGIRSLYRHTRFGARIVNVGPMGRSILHHAVSIPKRDYRLDHWGAILHGWPSGNSGRRLAYHPLGTCHRPPGTSRFRSRLPFSPILIVPRPVSCSQSLLRHAAPHKNLTPSHKGG